MGSVFCNHTYLETFLNTSPNNKLLMTLFQAILHIFSFSFSWLLSVYVCIHRNTHIGIDIYFEMYIHCFKI